MNRSIAEQYFYKFLYRRGVNNFDHYLLTRKLEHKCWNLNNQDYISILDNKQLFELFFSQFNVRVVNSYASNINSLFFLGEKIIQINSDKEFRDFLVQLLDKQSGSKGIFIKKKEASYGGSNIYKISMADLQAGRLNIKSVFNEVISSDYLFQDEVIQHQKLNELNPYCVNTIRMDTYTNKQQLSRVMSSFIRLGVQKSFVDNVSSGGMYVGVEVVSGTLCPEAFSDFTHGSGKTFKVHPDTGQKFEGFQIPFYQEAKNMVLEAARHVPQIKVIGWDIAIQSDGPILIEGNDCPGLVFSEIGQKGYLDNPVFMELFEEITNSRSEPPSN